jgi:SAM-dependent methyltransferase
VPFEGVFFKYLNKVDGKTCLEVGCVPGRYLVYICKNFGYFVEGIDFAKNTKSITELTLRENNIYDYIIYESDFTTWKSSKQYDLVCSFGFIEHFSGSTEKEIIKKHIELLKPGGKLILEVPNFNYGQYIIHALLDFRILKSHNIKTMNLSYYKKIAKNYGLKILYLGYWGGVFDFWAKTDHMNCIQKAIYWVLTRIKWSIAKTPIQNYNNRFFSPYIVFVAEKAQIE